MSGKEAFLVLSDGTVFRGQQLGARGATLGEVVFNTGMSGYQEILTDPSYAGQIVTLTYPLIGNYGINEDDFQSDVLQPRGLVVGRACEHPSHWRSRWSIHDYLAEKNLIGIQGVDTRALTLKIRSGGVTMGAITTQDPESALLAVNSAKTYDEEDLVWSVSTRTPYVWGKQGKLNLAEADISGSTRVVAIDCGLKHNILKRLAALNVMTIVLPARCTAEEILDYKPDGILLSPGPGDPARLDPIVKTVQSLLGQKPMLGICLGNQILSQALGGRTFKLKFGHRGSNHPVQDLATKMVTITSQNHGYAVDPDSLSGSGATITQINLNDGTVEGLEHKELRARSIQYHPEAAPGPWDARRFFSEFVEEIRN